MSKSKDFMLESLFINKFQTFINYSCIGFWTVSKDQAKNIASIGQ